MNSCLYISYFLNQKLYYYSVLFNYYNKINFFIYEKLIFNKYQNKI